MNLVDVIIIGFIGLTCFFGYKKGFIKTLFDTVGIILSFFLSRQSYYIIENFLLKNTKLYVKIYEFFEVKAMSFTEILQQSSTDIVESFRESTNLPIELQNLISNMFSSSSSTGADTFDLFVQNMSVIILRSISFVITFLIIYVILIIVANFINIIFKLPGLNITNGLFGAAIGVVKSIAILYIVFALASPIIGFVKDNTITDMILESESSKVFYENNIILNYLSYQGFYEN